MSGNPYKNEGYVTFNSTKYGQRIESTQLNPQVFLTLNGEKWIWVTKKRNSGSKLFSMTVRATGEA
ncbi:hypothetical protein P9H20_01070 [Lederbergia lenta]|uniref:Uncharacterized protein n=1 Tax=Lederbergia lenta TaxID=1467 RepID=A0A2X4WD44_LEDLE|nr:hypothetical protein [Lederbergia lenta]MCM3111769.1 hypothetical protein [Lederbergia lenta]MEC2322923.1 hypothetical protein [Lederbergia lenta]SQI62046.1 Uncharacterised protein [Lederbergia lenta]